MKEINAINTKKQRYFGRNTRTQDVENCSSESEGELEILFCCFFRLLHCKRLKYSVQKRESYCFLVVKYVRTGSRIWDYNNGN